MAEADKIVINGNHYLIVEVEKDPVFHCRNSCAFRLRCQGPEYQDVLYMKREDGTETICVAKPCEVMGRLMYGRHAKGRKFIFKLKRVCK